MVMQNMHLRALTRSIQLAGNMWAKQQTNVLLPDWLAVPGEPDLEVMRLTEDAILPRPCWVKLVPGPGSDNNNKEEVDDADDSVA